MKHDEPCAHSDSDLITAALTVGRALLYDEAWEMLAGDLHQVDDEESIEWLAAFRLLRQHAAASKQRAPMHHLDRRAGEIAALGVRGDGDDLLTAHSVADWLGVSLLWVQLGPSKGYGPRFVSINGSLKPRFIRYRRADVLDWLRERARAYAAKQGSRA